MLASVETISPPVLLIRPTVSFSSQIIACLLFFFSSNCICDYSEDVPNLHVEIHLRRRTRLLSSSLFIFLPTGRVLPDWRCDQGHRWGRWEVVLCSDSRLRAGPVLWKERSTDLVNPHPGQPKGPVWSWDIYCWWAMRILKFYSLKGIHMTS